MLLHQKELYTASTIATMHLQQNTYNKYHFYDAIVLLCKGRDQITERYVDFKYAISKSPFPCVKILLGD